MFYARNTSAGIQKQKEDLERAKKPSKTNNQSNIPPEEIRNIINSVGNPSSNFTIELQDVIEENAGHFAFEGDQDNIAINRLAPKELPTMESIECETPAHFHLKEYHLDKCISDIAYRHYLPAIWTQHDVVMTWRNNNFKVTQERGQSVLINGAKSFQRLPFYYITSLGTVSRKIEIVSCNCDHFSLESFENWLKEIKNG
jgi:hypothetical protein